MLKILRDNLKYLSWILWVVLGVFVLFVFVDFGGGLRGRGTPPSFAATVGSEQVSLSDFRATYRQMQERYQQAYGAQFTPELEKQLRLPLQALDQLIAQKILLAEAKKMGLRTSDRELRDAILHIKAFKDESGVFIGDQAYADLLRANNRSVEIFERELRDELTIEKLRSALTQTVHASDRQVEDAYRKQSERAKIRYVQLTAGKFAGQVQTTPADLQGYYDAHKQDFQLPEQRVIDYVLADSGKLINGVTLSEQDEQSYYDQHKAEFRSEEQVRARHVLLKLGEQRTAEQAETQLKAAHARVDKGEDFAKIATELSDDPGSKARGGDLGFFGRGRMIKEFEDAAFGAKPGEIVGPVKTSFGYHLIQVLEHRPGGERPFAEVKAQIENRLRSERSQGLAEAKARDFSQRLSQDTALDKSKLQAAASAEGLELATTPPFGRDEPVPGIGRGTPFTAAAFGLEKGKLSAPVRVPRGWAILFLEEAKPPRLPELAEAEAKVRQKVEGLKQQERALQELDQARQAVAAGKTLDQVAKDLGVGAQESPEFAPDGAIQGLGQNPALTQAVFALEAGQTGGPIATPLGGVIFQVTEHKHFDPAEFAKQKSDVRANLEREELNKLMGSMIEQRRIELKVSYDRRLLEQYGLTDQEGKTS